MTRTSRRTVVMPEVTALLAATEEYLAETDSGDFLIWKIHQKKMAMMLAAENLKKTMMEAGHEPPRVASQPTAGP
jgi:hypothetical protein